VSHWDWELDEQFLYWFLCEEEEELRRGEEEPPPKTWLIYLFIKLAQALTTSMVVTFKFLNVFHTYGLEQTFGQIYNIM
jgi:hypothetical protein